MPKLTVNGVENEVESGQRLVLAIEGTGVNIGHRCGGNAKCTTCRVSFTEGEPDTMTEAERDVLTEKGALGEVLFINLSPLIINSPFLPDHLRPRHVDRTGLSPRERRGVDRHRSPAGDEHHARPAMDREAVVSPL